MEDVKIEDDDDDDLFKSARGLEPEPAKVRTDHWIMRKHKKTRLIKSTN